MIQKTTLLKNVIQICCAAGQEKELFENEHFYLKVKNDPYMDLVIEAWTDPDGRKVSVAHYYEQYGDLVPDPEILLDADTGYPYSMEDYWGCRQVIWKDDGKTYIDPHAQKQVLAFMKMWARNIKLQGFVEAAQKQKARPEATETSA